MRWNELDLVVSTTATDLVALLLYECGSNGSIIHDEPDEQGRIRITAYFSPEKEQVAEAVRKQMKLLAQRDSSIGPWEIYQRSTDDADWLYTWQKYFHPKKISHRFWVAPVWERAVPAYGEFVINIDPGQAFGSGLHDTTSMCIRYLESAVKPGDIVFDIGTGTGILAIAAAKLGAAHVTAVDFDEKAVQQALVNTELNAADDVIYVCNSDLLTAIFAGYELADVVAANLVTDAVLALMPDLQAYMRKDAVFIASGIIDERIDEIRGAAVQCGFSWEEECLSNGWYAVRMRSL